MTELSPAAFAVWEAFSQDEAGVFVDYGDKLAAALRAAANQAVPLHVCNLGSTRGTTRLSVRQKLLAIADELEGTQ